MKKLMVLLLVVVISFSICACGNGNESEYNPNEGKLILTDELIAEMEEYFTTIPFETLYPDMSQAEYDLKSDCRASVVVSGVDVSFDSCEITSYGKEDDYHYIAYTIFKGTNPYGETVELKTSVLLFFKENTEEGYTIGSDFNQFEIDLKKLKD